MHQLIESTTKIVHNEIEQSYEFYSKDGQLIASIKDYEIEPLFRTEFVINEKLLNLLRSLRKQIAIEKDLPPFVIFLESTLADMARLFPTTILELERISGVPKGKAGRYGKPFLDLIANYLIEENISKREYVNTPDISLGNKKGAEYRVENNLETIKNHKEQVFVFLPAKEVSIFQAEQIIIACGDFMESLGYQLETENEPILGSFLQKMLFIIKDATSVTKKEIEEDFKKGKKALELKYVELPTAEQTEKLANSAAKIVELMKSQDEGIVRLGALIVLKKQINGRSKIIIQQLNYDLISILDKSPQLLQNLQTIYELLTGDVAGVKSLGETDTTKTKPL